MSTYTPGEFIPMMESDGGGCFGSAFVDELVFYGHVDEHGADWGSALDHADTGDEEPQREDWTRLRHMYGRKVPSGDGGWHFYSQREPGRGAFPVSVAYERFEVERRRLNRRAGRAITRLARRAFPDAVRISPHFWAHYCHKADKRIVAAMEAAVDLPGLSRPVRLNILERTASVTMGDLDTFRERNIDWRARIGWEVSQ